MKQYALMALASVSALMVAVPSNAALTISPIVTGSATFDNGDVTCAPTAPCSFSDLATFVTPAGYNTIAATISSIQLDAASNIDFTSVTLNGMAFTQISNGVFEFRVLPGMLVSAGATNTLAVAGTTGGNGSYSGTLVFSNAPTVPETATWAMMISGFGLVGGALRLRRKDVSFA